MSTKIHIEEIRDMVHAYLRCDSPYITPDMRLGVCSLFEQILHKTNNYYGFNYLEWINGGCEQWNKDGEPKDNIKYLGDQSRRIYY